MRARPPGAEAWRHLVLVGEQLGGPTPRGSGGESTSGGREVHRLSWGCASWCGGSGSSRVRSGRSGRSGRAARSGSCRAGAARQQHVRHLRAGDAQGVELVGQPLAGPAAHRGAFAQEARPARLVHRAEVPGGPVPIRPSRPRPGSATAWNASVYHRSQSDIREPSGPGRPRRRGAPVVPSTCQSPPQGRSSVARRRPGGRPSVRRRWPRRRPGRSCWSSRADVPGQLHRLGELRRRCSSRSRRRSSPRGRSSGRRSRRRCSAGRPRRPCHPAAGAGPTGRRVAAAPTASTTMSNSPASAVVTAEAPRRSATARRAGDRSCRRSPCR